MALYCDPGANAIIVIVIDDVIYSPLLCHCNSITLALRHHKQNCTILVCIKCYKRKLSYCTMRTREQKLKGALKVVKGALKVVKG